MANRRAAARLGQTGERLAQAFLENLGYRFVGRNWHCTQGELDLIMLDGDELVFVEVKTRRGEGSGRAGESVSSKKAARLLGSAEWYIAQHAEHQERVWRCDLVAITMSRSALQPRILHVVNAIVTG